MTSAVPTYSVLLVEDDQRCAEALHSVIELHAAPRFEVHKVRSIAECIDALNTNQFSVILLDLNLRNGQGLDTFTRINKAANRDLGTPQEVRTPIVIITGDTMVDYSTVIIEKAMDFVRKPVERQDLCERLHMAILRNMWTKLDELNKGMTALLETAK